MDVLGTKIMKQNEINTKEKKKKTNIGHHGGLVVCTVSSQKEGSLFEPPHKIAI